MKRIGSRFPLELRAAGCRTEGLAWGEDGSISFTGQWSQAEQDAVLAVYAAHDPAASDAADAAVAQREATDAAECEAAKADNQVRAFLNMTPAELDAWVDTNIGAAGTLAALRTSTATALKVLGRLAQQGARGRRVR